MDWLIGLQDLSVCTTGAAWNQPRGSADLQRSNAWASEQWRFRLSFVAEDVEKILAMKGEKDYLSRFASYMMGRTGRKWSFEDLNILWKRVLFHIERHHPRQPIRYQDWLHLLFTAPLRCATCGARPPDVQLEIDHLFPASRGGSSRPENLRFLCQKHNRKKSDRLEEGSPWLNLK